MSSKNPQSDYDQALDLKNKGNECFKAGNLKGALKNYSRIFMHIGMNPCMNMSQMMGAGGDPSQARVPQQQKDPLQQKTDELRLTAFNNMAAVYAKMNKWDDCKEKCSRVLKVDDKNTKALFRRGMAHRKLNLYELARADLEKAKQIIGNRKDAAIEREIKLLTKDEKNADKEFYAKMKKQMQKAKKQKQKKKQEKLAEKKKKEEEEKKKDDNVNLKANANTNDTSFIWDVPQDNNNNNKNQNNNKKDDNKKKEELTNESNEKNKMETDNVVEDTANNDKGNENETDKATEQPSEF